MSAPMPAIGTAHRGTTINRIECGLTGIPKKREPTEIVTTRDGSESSRNADTEARISAYLYTGKVAK
jgi:hypothetical protein